MTSTKRPLLLGHRGARLRHLPENTLAAFDTALQAGCDGFEFDVRCTGDRQLVIIHDARSCGAQVAGCTYAELQQRWGERIVPRLPLTQRRSLPHEQLAMPCLQDVLQRYAGRAFLDIELKTVGMEAAVLESLRQHPPRRGYVVSSFLPQVLRELAACDAETPLGLICDSTRQLALWPKLSLAFVIPHYKLASQELVEELHAAGKKIIVWTVNPEDQMRRAADWGVDGIVSDDPELLARVIA